MKKNLFLLLIVWIVSARYSDARQSDAAQTVVHTLKASALPAPKDIPVRWKPFIGEFTANGDSVFVLEKLGSLQILQKRTGQVFDLIEIAGGRFKFRGPGLLRDSLLTFQKVAGTAGVFRTGSIQYINFPLGGANGGTFRIRPLKPYNELYKEARAANPPQQAPDLLKPQLTELKKLEPTIQLDIRYATTNNFMGSRFYSEPRAFLQRPAADAALRAHRWLRQFGFGLLIHDAYRPWYVTKMFWDATPNEQHDFVANPSQGSRHNRGCAADLTLYDLKTGKPVDMVSGYDEFSQRAFPDYPGGTSLQRWHRALLREAMEAEGFQVYQFEWWHFDYKDWQQYPVMNVTFDKIQ
jgi:D-alanyl-D-alanine dipeptidase